MAEMNGTDRKRGGELVLPRPRLVDAVVGSHRVALIEAGGGFGKSVLTSQVARAADVESLRIALPLRGSVEVDDLRELLRTVELEPPDHPRVTPGTRASSAPPRRPPNRAELVVIDNAQSLSEEAAGWLADVVREAEPIRVVISGRVIPRPLSALELQGTAVHLDSTDLRLTPDETRELVQMEIGPEEGAKLWATLHHFSDGWLALLLLIVRRLSRTSDRVAAVSEIVRRPIVVGQLVDHFASDLSPAEQDLLVQLAHFPLLSETVMDALGAPGLFRRLSHAGIAFSVGPDGWWRLCDVMKQHLAAKAPLERNVAQRAAPLLVAHGAELAGTELLTAIDDYEAAANLLAAVPTSRIDCLDPEALAHQVARLGKVADTTPRVLLHLARSYGNVGRLAEERRVIERAQEAINGLEPYDDDLAIEVEAESLFQRAMLNDSSCVDRIRDLLEHVSPQTRGQARLLEALSVVLSERPDEASLQQAENCMRHAAIIWSDLGEGPRAASVQRGLAVRVLAARGKFGEAARLLEQLAEASETVYDRMLCLVFAARLLSLHGRASRADAALTQALQLGDVLDIEWVAGHAAWTRLLLAANGNDRIGVVDQLATAESQLGQLANDAGGLLFLCEATDACAAVGAHPETSRLLSAAQARRAEDPPLVGLTETLVEARVGKPEAASRLQGLVDKASVEPGLLWKAQLLIAYAEMASGNVDGARRGLEACFEQAARIGHPELPERRELPVVEALRSTVARHPAPLDHAGAGQPLRYKIRVLGGFEVQRDGEPVEASGRAAQLVQYLALADGRAPMEVAVEAMWPDEAPGVGQRRLRNVLSRGRVAYGPLVARTGPTLELVDCHIDLSQFDKQAGAVATTRGPERIRKAQEALASYTGPVLPDQLYDDWINQRREAIRRRVLGLVDIVLAAHLESDDLDGAIRLLRFAAEIDPYDQERALRVVRCLLESGRGPEATALASEALATATELDLPASLEWQELGFVAPD